MSDKPRINATCAAGCLWETVHKQDFLNACSFVKLTGADNEWLLDLGRQYKIISENVAGVGYGFTITFKYKDNGTETLYNFTIPHEDKYANYVVFKLLEASANGTTLTLVYEIAGVRYLETITGTNLSLLEKDYILVKNADAVYLFKDDAGLILEYTLDEFAQSELAKKQDKLTEKEIFLLSHPIKSLYITEEEESPVDKYGGGWLKIQGKFLLGADGSTYKVGDSDGGSATHTLTINEMPSHTHAYNGWAQTMPSASGNGYALTKPFDTFNNFGETVKYTGGSQPFNIMNPYHIVNIWKRIS